jgi:hypothetical protein
MIQLAVQSSTGVTTVIRVLQPGLRLPPPARCARPTAGIGKQTVRHKVQNGIRVPRGLNDARFAPLWSRFPRGRRGRGTPWLG